MTKLTSLLISGFTLLTWGCSPMAEYGGGKPSPYPSDEPMPDFSLADVNAASPTFSTNISPRSHLGEVSAWYFGHAT